MQQAIHFINGQWVAGEGSPITSVDPTKNQTFWRGQAASGTQVDSALNAARAALPQWSAKTVEETWIKVLKKDLKALI